MDICLGQRQGRCDARWLLGLGWLIMILGGMAIAADEDRANFPEGPWAFRVFYKDVDVIRQLGAYTEPRLVHKGSGETIIFADDALLEKLADLPLRLEYDAAQTAGFHGVATRMEFGKKAGIPGFPCYPTITETEALIQAWETDHPNLVSLVDIGDSWEKINAPPAGFDLWVARLTNQQISGPKPTLFVMSSIHPREYTTAPLITHFGSYLLENYGFNADVTWLLDHHEIHLIPLSNPDGRMRAEAGLSWRKNADNDFCMDTNNRGIDLNRNFPFQWSCCGGASDDPCAITFRGPSASSEPEIQAITNYVRTIFADNRGPALSDPAPVDTPGVFLDVHSFSELIIWPYGFDSTPAPNGASLQTMGRKLGFFNQYFPAEASALFNADGSTVDFAYGELGVASFAFELGTSFFQDCRTFENEILPRNLQALLYAAKAARAPYQLPAGPDPIEVRFIDNILQPGERLQVCTILDDSRFNQTNGSESVETIALAEAWLNTPPWQSSAGGVPIAMSAQDGAFDEAQEMAEVQIPTTGLAEGNHMVFVRARDSQNQWGVVSAGMFSVLDPTTAARFSGNVREWASGKPLVATVSNGPFTVPSDANTGAYELLLVPGNHRLTATTANHEPGEPMIANLSPSGNVQVNWELLPGCATLDEGGEQGPGDWQVTGGWTLSDEAARTGQFAWNDSPGRLFAANTRAELVSPAIDLKGMQAVRLAFWHRHFFPDINDSGTVSWSADGTNWQELIRVTRDQSEWTQVELDLTPALGSETIRLRFLLSSNSFDHGDGWQIDDITVTGFSPRCVDEAGRMLALERWPQPVSVLTLLDLEPMIQP